MFRPVFSILYFIYDSINCPTTQFFFFCPRPNFLNELARKRLLCKLGTYSTLSTPEIPPVEFPHTFGFQIVNTPPCLQNSIIVNPPSPSEILKAVRGMVWIFSGIAQSLGKPGWQSAVRAFTSRQCVTQVQIPVLTPYGG